MVKKTDQKTLDLIKEVNRRKAEISKLERPVWLTNCSFSYVEGNASNSINIHVESNVKNLIAIAAFLMERNESYGKAANLLQIEAAPEFTWGGFRVNEWIEDIKTRINKSQIATKQKKLAELESRLNAIISPELKAELELEAIASELT